MSVKPGLVISSSRSAQRGSHGAGQAGSWPRKPVRPLGGGNAWPQKPGTVTTPWCCLTFSGSVHHEPPFRFQFGFTSNDLEAEPPSGFGPSLCWQLALSSWEEVTFVLSGQACGASDTPRPVGGGFRQGGRESLSSRPKSATCRAFGRLQSFLLPKPRVHGRAWAQPASYCGHSGSYGRDLCP